MDGRNRTPEKEVEVSSSDVGDEDSGVAEETELRRTEGILLCLGGPITS